jgi:O-antigen ligase
MPRAVAASIESSENMRLHNGHIIGSAAFLVCGVGVFVPLGLAPLIGIAAIAAAVLHRRNFGQWPHPPLALSAIFAALAVLGALSAVWSIDRGDTLVGLSRLVPLLLAGGLLVGAARRLTAEETRTLIWLFAAGAAVALLLLAVERFAGAPIRHLTQPDLSDGLIGVSFNRGASVIALWLWPLALVAWRWKPAVAAVLWLAVFALLATLENASAVLALSVGAAVCLSAYLAPRATPLALASLCGALILAAPLVPHVMPAPLSIKEAVPDLPRSAYHRLLIWGFTVDRIAELPVLGWGLRTSRDIPGREIQLDTSEPALPLHPHNGVLQLWLELGAPGALLGAALLVMILVAIARSRAPPEARAAATAMVMSALVMVCLSYGIWQSWWLAALWMTAAFMAVLMRKQPGGALPPRDGAAATP